MKTQKTSTKKDQSSKIESGKVFVNRVLSDFWFCIPDYQRSYVWEDEQINELLDDVSFAAKEHPSGEYFLGSLVLQKKTVQEAHKDGNGISYDEFDVLDGQQRLTTLILLCSVLRDLTENEQLVSTCERCIVQKANRFQGIPSRTRLVFRIRDNVEEFMKDYVSEKNGTENEGDLEQKSTEKNVSISNMAKAILRIRNFFKHWPEPEINAFAEFLFQNVLFIYVSSEDLEDAFRLFTILNDRGLPLSNSDILKSSNLGSITDPIEREKAAHFWEETEGEFGREDFDRLLSFIRTIYVKDKARENVLKEFEEKIYKPNLLARGKQTIDVIKKYSETYNRLIWFNGSSGTLSNEFKNLVTVMSHGFPSTDWVPPLLFYFNKFGEQMIVEFLRKLDKKFSGDWIAQLTPTERINSMNETLKAIEKARNAEALVGSDELFRVDRSALIERLNRDVYGRKFAKYVLLKMEWVHKDHTSQFPAFNQVSVEHVLPQNPKQKSKWWDDFSQSDFENWLDKIGNLVLISRRKNSELSNADFSLKKKRYFSGNIDAFPNSLRVMENDKWTPEKIESRQKEMIGELKTLYEQK